MRYSLYMIPACVALQLLLACSSREAARPDGGSASSASSSSQGKTASQASSQAAVVTVNNPVFVRDVWSNVRDISAANRNFLTGGTTAVAGVRSYKMTDAAASGQPQQIPRLELEKSISELRKILADPALSVTDRSRCQYYLGACLIQLGDARGGKAAFQEAVRLERNGKWGRLAAVELAK